MLVTQVNKQKLITFLLLGLFLGWGLVIAAAPAFAQEAEAEEEVEYVKELNYTLQVPIGTLKTVEDLGDYIREFYNYFMLAAGVLATFMIMFGGYIWVTALGNREKISRAKEFIFSAITGLLLALLSYLLLYTINPSIVELRPLNVAILKPPNVGGPVAVLCNWGCVDPTDPGGDNPVMCSEVVDVPEDDDVCVGSLGSGGDEEISRSCSGIIVKNDNDICMISEDRRGSKTGTAKTSLSVPVAGIVDVNNDKPCGVLWYNAGKLEFDGWRLGSECSNEPYNGGKKQSGRCIMDGEYPVFSNTKGTDDCDIEKATSESWCESAEIRGRGFCGCITNMKCYGP